MFSNTLGLLFLSLVAHHVLAGPVPEPQITAPAKLEERDLNKRVATCTFSSSDGASRASVSKTQCSTIILSALAVPSGTTLDLTGLNDGTHVIFEGETTFGVEQWTGPLVSISGTNIVVTGASGHSLNGNGGSYWDGKGGSGGSTKPKFFAAHSMTSATIQSVSIVNSPVQVFSISSCDDLALLGITINNSAGASLGKNTDGFDIGSSTGIYISGAYVNNQDDCVAINSGTNITFTGGTCTGGHGLSIGSIGGRSDNTVQSVLFESSTVENSQNGVRVKTIYGDTGLVADVTYKDITLSDITQYGIIIEQNYDDTSEPPSNGVTISALTLSTVTGSVASSATDIAILCGSGSCEDWTWSHVTVTGGKKDASCTNVPSVASC